ncbi:MAG: sigma-54-dependent Fis family transcriptional regulator, partial [Solirubrobacterales bacterium]|nr:sigma-54-dependent Fis family transcriptional regulator [Solirubrobacterales bacterium]
MATILVIDDEASILHAFRRAFADPEDTLETASDGSEGLELVARLRPDVVVLDLNLPDISGLDVFHRIRTIDARIPVIFITGQGTTETAIEAMKRGAFEYLLKPVDFHQLRGVVNRALELNRLTRVPAVFEENDVRVLTAATAAAGLEALRREGPDVVVLDLQLPDRSGLELFREIQALDAKRPVLFITAHGTTETAIEAMKRGAFEYLLKPLDYHQVREVVARAVELSRLRHVPAVFEGAEAADDAAVDRIVGRCPAMQEVYKAIGRVAPLDVPVLLTGESGTGKELVARAIYQHSRRADKPFLPLNCAAIPETLLESGLFGHERGAFTGADRRRIGKFEQV